MRDFFRCIVMLGFLLLITMLMTWSKAGTLAEEKLRAEPGDEEGAKQINEVNKMLSAVFALVFIVFWCIQSLRVSSDLCTEKRERTREVLIITQIFYHQKS